MLVGGVVVAVVVAVVLEVVELADEEPHAASPSVSIAASNTALRRCGAADRGLVSWLVSTGGV